MGVSMIGWLVLRDKYHILNKDYLYYLLSSKYVYYQFSNKVSGAVVNNLNSEKVKQVIIPIPPQNEQKKISNKLEMIFKTIETAE